ncbi:MAG: hypothetical protein JNM78_17315 [Cyclobacteriaceae bacterium]|nr:hypothetical protein [Cyclobacteriaceae bacterium]
MRAIFFIFCLFSTSRAFAQLVVKGVVYDREGPIHGVVVTEQKTDSLVNKVVTNHRGEFEIIALNPKPRLQFTFVGLVPKTILVKDKDPLRVKMRFDVRRYQSIEKN